MNIPRNAGRWRGVPLALQITALLLGGLVVAQAVTLALTWLLPPEPPAQYELRDIARALSVTAGVEQGQALMQGSLQGEPPREFRRGLQQVLQPAAPEMKGPGWLTSERSRRDLARMLARELGDVRLFFFTPLPFAGSAATAPPEPGGRGGPGGPGGPDGRRGPGGPDGPRGPGGAGGPEGPGGFDAAGDFMLPPPRAPRGLFGFGPPPFVQGDFVAAMKTADGRWAVVQPTPEAFPNAWQRRVLLWFAIAAAMIMPMGWWFSQRLVRPLGSFAAAAERLGRDPAAPVPAIAGPAEVGRAAQAFNRMQSRLRNFVDDRTAMIGAISHDLRTPLTRMRFRIEDLPDAQRQGLLGDVVEMEEMIRSVLAFIQDVSEPGTREPLDLASLLADVVEDAVFIGQPVRLDRHEQALVEVDAIGLRRVLGNLIENAVKYGDSAEVASFTEGNEAVVEVRDHGPGLQDEELERVFQPFYRSLAARTSGKPGSGLGLAVCRSIARAHGGDVKLARGARGLVAQLRLPLIYGEANA